MAPLDAYTADAWLGGSAFASPNDVAAAQGAASGDAPTMPTDGRRPDRIIDDPVAWFVVAVAAVLILGYLAGEPD